MVVINYPEPAFRLRKKEETEEIFDSQRKKWIALTPEEWVRQNFVQFMVSVKKYPASLIAVEKELKLGELKKRFDILVFNSRHEPWLMVECKAMDVLLDEEVLQQALRYNISIPVSFIIITNGNYTMGWQRGETGLHEISILPDHE